MIILGVDYGRAKIGLAIAEGPLAEPHSVLRVVSMEDAITKTADKVKVLGAEKIVVGMSEGEMGKEQERFAELLRNKTEIEVITWDETLSTQDAQLISIQSGAGQKKRREKEDAFAAALVIQSYLDGTTT